MKFLRNSTLLAAALLVAGAANATAFRINISDLTGTLSAGLFVNGTAAGLGGITCNIVPETCSQAIGVGLIIPIGVNSNTVFGSYHFNIFAGF